MATNVCILAICILSLFHISAGINAYIAENAPVILAGSNLTLHCIVNLTGESTRSASDVVWIKNFSDQVDSAHVATTLNESVAALHIINATFNDRGTYFCAFEEEGYMQYFMTATSVHVGYPPEPVKNLRCYSTNVRDYTCTWQDGKQTNLKTVDTMYYIGNTEACHPEGEENYCTVHGQPRSTITVVSVNALGESTADLGEFDPDLEVRPNPPDCVRTDIAEPRSINVSWQPPSDWFSVYAIDYWIQYRTAESEWFNVTYESIDTRSYSLHSLLPHTEYYIRIAAASDVLVGHGYHNVFGEWSDEVAQTTMAEGEQ